MWYRICAALFKRSCSSPRHLCVNECPPPGPERSASVRCIRPNHAWEREKLDPPCGQKRTPNVSPGITFVPVPTPVSRSVKLRRKVTFTAAASAPGTIRARGALRAIKAILPLGSRGFLQVVRLGFAFAPLHTLAVRGPDRGLAPLDLADDRTQLEAQILGDSAPAHLLAAELFDLGEGLLRRHRSLGGSRQVLGHRQADGDFSPAHLLVA